MYITQREMLEKNKGKVINACHFLVTKEQKYYTTEITCWIHQTRFYFKVQPTIQFLHQLSTQVAKSNQG